MATIQLQELRESGSILFGSTPILKGILTGGFSGLLQPHGLAQLVLS
jgi:hypothetical protein